MGTIQLDAVDALQPLASPADHFNRVSLADREVNPLFTSAGVWPFAEDLCQGLCSVSLLVVKLDVGVHDLPSLRRQYPVHPWIIVMKPGEFCVRICS